MNWKLDNVLHWRFRLHRLVVSLSVGPMDLWIVQQRRRRFLSLGYLAQRLGVLFEQGKDHLSDLPRQAAHDGQFPFVGPRSFVPTAFDRDQSLIELGPFAVFLLDGVADDEKKHLLHGSGPRSRQLGPVQCASRLGDSWSPAEVRFETGCTLKVVNVADAGDDGCRLDGTDGWNGSQNLSLAGVLYSFSELYIKLIKVLLQDIQISNELPLFDSPGPRSRPTSFVPMLWLANRCNSTSFASLSLRL